MDNVIHQEKHAAAADLNRVDIALDTSKGAALGAVVGVVLPFFLQESLLFLAIPVLGSIVGGIGGLLIGKNRRAEHRHPATD